MKVAILKQKYDVFGPWSTVEWSSDLTKLFQYWPNKTTYLEMTLLFEADWYVTSLEYPTGYTNDVVNRVPETHRIMDENVQDVVPIEEIPFGDYDVIISMDPLPEVSSHGVLSAYICQEDWDTVYRNSLKDGPQNGYDLFLDHMLKSKYAVPHLPCSVSFPYPRCPEIIRGIFDQKQEERLWVEWRTVTAKTRKDLWDDSADGVVREIEDKISIPVNVHRNFGRTYYGMTDPPKWNSGVEYLTDLRRCKYYMGVGRRSGAGQGLIDAASLGCLCLGDRNKLYHKEICHPSCLFGGMSEALKTLQEIQGSQPRIDEILAHQDKAVLEKFSEYPKRILEEALALR
jgi:hypothetical protein